MRSLALIGLLLANPLTAGEKFARLSPTHLLTYVSSGSDPVCTDPDARNGPLVADLELNPKGKLMGITILQAPSLLLATCARDALVTWKFRPIGGGFRYFGKVIFYWSDGVMRPAAKAGYVGD